MRETALKKGAVFREHLLLYKQENLRFRDTEPRPLNKNGLNQFKSKG